MQKLHELIIESSLDFKCKTTGTITGREHSQLSSSFSVQWIVSGWWNVPSRIRKFFQETMPLKSVFCRTVETFRVYRVFLRKWSDVRQATKLRTMAEEGQASRVSDDFVWISFLGRHLARRTKAGTIFRINVVEPCWESVFKVVGRKRTCLQSYNTGRSKVSFRNLFVKKLQGIPRMMGQFSR